MTNLRVYEMNSSEWVDFQELHQRFSEALKEVQSRCKTSETRYQHVTEEHERLKAAADQMKTELQQAIEARQSLEEQRYGFCRSSDNSRKRTNENAHYIGFGHVVAECSTIVLQNIVCNTIVLH